MNDLTDINIIDTNSLNSGNYTYSPGLKERIHKLVSDEPDNVTVVYA